MTHTLDDLYRILSDPISTGEHRMAELEEAMKEAAEIICLVDDWATAKKALKSVMAENASGWSVEVGTYLDAIKDLYERAKP